ncbi:MAG: purine-nucleoside phosphorylase [Fidelibacterota bacterium]
MNYLSKVNEAYTHLRNFLPEKVDFGLIAGSYLSELFNHFTPIKRIPYQQIPHFQRSSLIEGGGELCLLETDERAVILYNGLVYSHEGFTLREITLPIRMFGMFGVSFIILADAALPTMSEIDRQTITLAKDHVNLMGDNPLRGKNYNELGLRFPDMSKIYSQSLKDNIDRAAVKMGIEIKEIVYAALNNPGFLTGAEKKLFRDLGIDAIAPGIVGEAITACHSNIPFAAFLILKNSLSDVTEMSLLKNLKELIMYLFKQTDIS